MSSTNFNYWPQVLDYLRSKIPGSNFTAWFSGLEFKGLNNEGRKIVLTAPSDFHKKYIEKKFNVELRESINKFYPKVIHLEIKIKEGERGAKKQVQDALDLKVAEQRKISQTEVDIENDKEKIASYLPRKNLNNLNPKYTFENFVITKSNEFTVNLAKGVVVELGTLYNPLFIHSPVGLGKTHLIQAVGHAVLEKNPSLNIKYVPSDTFFNQFYLALTKGETHKFRDFYSSVDLLLVDDIQFIGGKEGFQNQLFHIFNLLHQENKQIIFTSDRNPKDLIGVEDRLVSRFEWGMVTDIQKPDQNDILLILNDKLKRAGIILKDEQANLIAEKVNDNIRELEGVINKIKAVLSTEIDKELSQRGLLKILEPYLDQKTDSKLAYDTKKINPEKVMDAVCKVYMVEKDDILGSNRKAAVAEARQVCFWIMKQELGMSFPMIGKSFGGRDHSTIIHGVKKLQKMIDNRENNINTKIGLIKQIFQN